MTLRLVPFSQTTKVGGQGWLWEADSHGMFEVASSAIPLPLPHRKQPYTEGIEPFVDARVLVSVITRSQLTGVLRWIVHLCRLWAVVTRHLAVPAQLAHANECDGVCSSLYCARGTCSCLQCTLNIEFNICCILMT